MAIRFNFKNPPSSVKEKLKTPKTNWIYFHHLKHGIYIPVDPESITDSMSANWAQSTPLSRSAPIYSYQSSGPRTVQLSFSLHRDLMNEFNPSETDAVDKLINELEACVLPDYRETGKIVNPPIVSVKLRDEIYIKGVVSNVSKTFHLPIINYGGKDKYALVDISFQVSEITPYSASIINNGNKKGGNKGGFRKPSKLMG